eukprot:463893_1
MDHHYHGQQQMTELKRTTCQTTNNIVNKSANSSHSQSQSQYSFKFEHIVDFTFLNETKDEEYSSSSRFFLGNHVSCSIKSHFCAKYHRRHNGSGAISIPDELYHEMSSLESQILSLLQYEYISHTSIIDIHIVYLQPIHCLGLLVYAHTPHTPLSLPIFSKYFTVIGLIEAKCSKYWECPNFKCRYELNRITDIHERIFFCEECKNDFTFEHNPNNHHYYHSTKNKKIRSCIKYRFLSHDDDESNNVYNNSHLFEAMSHEEFQQMTAKESELKKRKTQSQITKECDWMDRLELQNLEKWFSHRAGTKLGLNDYQFDAFEELNQILSVRSGTGGERHGVDHECMACKPYLMCSDDGEKTWLCSLCQKTIPIDIKTCICISSDHPTTNHISSCNDADKQKDCLIVIKELAETLHSTISFKQIPAQLKRSSAPFEYEVCFNGQMIANGNGNSKRKAQRHGAQVALNILSSRSDEIARKIHLVQQFDRIGHCEIDPNLFVEVCADICGDETQMYSIRPLHEYGADCVVMNPRHVMIDDIIALRTRTLEISHLEEPSVLGCLDVRGPLKFSLVCGIFHKDVNNGRYGYNKRNRRKSHHKRNRRKNKKEKGSKSVAINTMMGLERRNTTYSPHAHHEMYSSKREKSKRRRSRSRRLNHHKLEHHGVFTCAQCRTYYADNSNGQYLKEEKWFCNECLKKQQQQQFVYTEKRSKTKKKNKTTTTPPMTPPSSVEEEEEEKKEEEVEEEEEDESDVVETVSTATQCDQKVYHNNKMYHQMYHHHHLYAQQPYNLQNSWNAYYGNMFHNNQQQTAALNSYNI